MYSRVSLIRERKVYTSKVPGTNKNRESISPFAITQPLVSREEQLNSKNRVPTKLWVQEVDTTGGRRLFVCLFGYRILERFAKNMITSQLHIAALVDISFGHNIRNIANDHAYNKTKAAILKVRYLFRWE